VIAVDSGSYADSAHAFERANQDAALVFDSLSGKLAHCGGMAGDSSISADFAAAYDEAAQLALDSVGDLVDAFAACGRLTTASLTNHGHAENRSVISGRTVFDGGLCVSGYVAVLPCSLPSCLGGDLSGLPGWASWILDQVEGFVWPDADTDLLREAAACWRSAAAQVDDLSAHCSVAVESFANLRSPEVPVAIEVAEAMAARCHGVADQCLALATACETYADHVEEQRAAILDLVHDLIRDAVVIEGVGILLSSVTVGTTAAGATALNAARIAAAAPRLLRIIETLRSLASTCAAPLRYAVTALHDVRAQLSIFRRVRVTLASAYDAERLARVARLREIVQSNRLLDPNDLRGLSPKQVRELCEGWPAKPSGEGVGVVYRDPGNYGRHIRVMEGYPPGSRPDPITWGPYAQVSQNGDKIKIPLEGNPAL
jgi:hypothetical protein